MLPARRVTDPALGSVTVTLMRQTEVMQGTPTRQIDTVLFDMGGVLMKNGRHSDLASRFPPEHAALALKIFMGDYGEDNDHPWHRLERGEITYAECKRLNAIALAEHGISLPALVRDNANEETLKEQTLTDQALTDQALTEQPAAGPSFRPDNEMIDLIRRLRAAGLRTGVVTNNVREFRSMWQPLLPYDELFDDLIDSHEVGIRKPNPAIYQLALTRLNARAERTAFLDDVLSNVEAATNLGIFGVIVDEDSAPARATVARLAGLTAAGG